MDEQKEIWTAWTPLGLMMPSLGLKTKQAPKAEVGEITLKRASMLPLLESIAYTDKKKQEWKGRQRASDLLSRKHAAVLFNTNTETVAGIRTARKLSGRNEQSPLLNVWK